jgi:hypothetical protein
MPKVLRASWNLVKLLSRIKFSLIRKQKVIIYIKVKANEIHKYNWNTTIVVKCRKLKLGAKKRNIRIVSFGARY